jgi:hypothetical protein
MHQNLSDGNYDSIVDFLTAVELPCRNADNKPTWSHFFEDDQQRNWYGADCKNGRAVLATMRTGWKEGRDRLNELRSKIGTIEITPVDIRRRPIRSDMGDELDIHSVYAGRLDIAWRTAKRQVTVAPPRVDILANMICSGGEHSDVLFWRGAAAAVLTDILENAGYMVRMVVGFGGRAYPVKGASEPEVSCRIVVKDHGMPLDISSTSAVILPGFFRALGHAWIYNHAKPYLANCGISVRQGRVEEGELLLSHKVRDHGTALAFINETLTRINEGMSLGEAA